MKVVHISTYDTGGAATAALRLHTGLLQQGVQSSFLCLRKATNKQGVCRYEQPHIKKSIAKRILNRAGIRQLSVEEKNNESIKTLHGEYEKAFSFPTSDYSVEQHPLIKEADVIHLHWVAEFLNYPGFFSSIKKPVVWTLHDMNPFLGGFHYTGDDERNAVGYKAVNEKALHLKKEVIAKIESLIVISPSGWLLKAAVESNVFRQADFKHIRYGLDTNIFKPHEKRFARNIFNLPEDVTIFLFVSESVNNYRKGFDLIVDAIKQLELQDNYILLTVGTVYTNLPKAENIIHLGSINDERLMSLAYSAADLFILPSREDNFPNTMLESFACGTPVLAFKTGGMAEEIEDGFNGFFAEEMSGSSIANALRDFIENTFSFDREAIHRKAKEKYALAKQASEYEEIYKSVQN